MEMFSSSESLAGALLLAHPALLDPNFARTVVLISSHTVEDGAWGAIINRPMGKTLGEHAENFAMDPLGRIPLYRGGPVRENEVVLAAWQFREEEGLFRLLYGIDPEQARGLLGDESYCVRAFLGYSGWDRGQLEAELGQNSWLIGRVEGSVLNHEGGTDLWRQMVSGISPELWLLANSPEDPSSN
jgi:putative transcriptional regulator